jgi:DNA replication protein DnaC
VDQLLKAEGAERPVRLIAYQMKAARFRAHRDLAGFEFGSSAVDEALVRKLHSTAFTETAHNVVFIGGPGTGKTHPATALGVESSNAMPSACASTRRWSWSMRWRQRRRPVSRARSPIG